MSPERARIYLEELSEFTEAATEFALLAAVSQWDRPNMLPTVAFLRERVAEYYTAAQRRQVEASTQRLLARGDKPDGWELGTGASERQRYFRAYANAPQAVRDVMKTMGDRRAMEYSAKCGVPQDRIIAPNERAASVLAELDEVLGRLAPSAPADSDGGMGARA